MCHKQKHKQIFDLCSLCSSHSNNAFHEIPKKNHDEFWKMHEYFFMFHHMNFHDFSHFTVHIHPLKNCKYSLHFNSHPFACKIFDDLISYIVQLCITIYVYIVSPILTKVSYDDLLWTKQSQKNCQLKILKVLSFIFRMDYTKKPELKPTTNRVRKSHTPIFSSLQVIHLLHLALKFFSESFSLSLNTQPQPPPPSPLTTISLLLW